MADDGGGTAQQTTAVGRPFSWFYAIDRSLKNNDQKDIPLDDRDWAKARDVSIVRRHGRAGDMSFVMYWRTVDYGHGRAETRVPCALLPYCECGGAQNDEGKANAAAAREFFVEGQAREQYRNKDRELVDLYHDAYLPGGNGVVVEQP